MREINDRAAIDALLHNGPLTRAELEGIIGLSKPATAALLTRLEGADMVRRGELRGGNRGPRAQTWTVNGGLAHVAGVNLTPEAVHIVIADLAGSIRHEQRTEMPPGDRQPVPPAFAEALVEATGAVGLRPDLLCHVVVGSPGAVEPRTGHLVFAPHLPGWEGFDMPGELRKLLGAAVTVENDVNLVALEEMNSGSARDVRDFVLLWLSRGIGAAVVINRTLLRGATGGAGEVDWMWVPDRASRDTGVGRDGVRLGDLLGEESVVRLAHAHGFEVRDFETAVREAVAAGASGEEFLTDLARRIATGIAGVVSVVDPELVLLSAEMAQAGGAKLAELVSAELRSLVVPRTPVEPAMLTGDPVRAGALHVALGLARHQVFGLPETMA